MKPKRWPDGTPHRHINVRKISTPMPTYRATHAIGMIAALCLVAAFALHHQIHEPPIPTETLVRTNGTFEEAGVVMPADIDAELTKLGEAHQTVRRIDVNGDGAVNSTIVDLTPREGRQILKVPVRADEAIHKNVNELVKSMNSIQTTAPGRSLLAGLQQAGRYPHDGRIIAFSSGLDLTNPLNVRALGWETDPDRVVAFLDKHGELPKLHGRELHIVLTPTVGDQQQPRQPQLDYLHALWTKIGTAAGASVTVTDGQPATSTSTFRVPIVAIPSAPQTPIEPIRNGSTTTCVLASPAYFHPDTAALLDKSAVIKALTACAKTTRPGSFDISIVGHVALDLDGLDAGSELARQRAEVIGGLLEHDLGVPGSAITSISGVGPSQPLVQPAADPRNRAVVVTFRKKTQRRMK
jgi:hypothetical protein